jgi:hypothetical protein
MTKRQKDKQYNGQKTRTANIMAKRQKDSQYNGQKTEGQPIIYKTLHRKVKTEKHNFVAFNKKK